MKFQKGTRRRALEYEKDLVQYWKMHKTFEKSVDQRSADNAYVFYDGPPFLTGTPHHGHLLISTVKDAVARYQTMQGKRVERRWGWDCHGLPAELFVEKKLGIANKKEIGTKISIDDYVKECRAAMVKTGTEWEDTIERLGRWVEFNDAYKTMDNEYMESVWWAFKQLYETGKIYEGEKILVYCTKDATPISKSEVAMENSYKLDTDPSVYVYFELEDSDESVLAWTTTPWTLPANVAIAVNPALEYALVEYEGKKTYVATAAVEKVFTDEKRRPLEYKVLRKLAGTELIGRSYQPLFENRGPASHHILAADFVTAEDGTGIVHEAPAYGEEDYELCKREGVPTVSLVDENGIYTEGRWQGEYIWDINKEIAKSLVAEGKALKVEYIQHEYPHCHRCGTKLMYRAHPSWFMDIQGQKSDMIESNSQTNWMPEHLKEGRFKNILESAPDWNLSRDRYWATPIPVWKGTRTDGTDVVKVFGSFEEFAQIFGKQLEDYHLPHVMNLEFEQGGVTMRHIGKVLDCWFESGSMPFAQFHYPFENKQKFEQSFPADFIVEAIDQTRGWFYSLTAVNVGLFGKSPFKNLICTGFINAADGKKMSKKLKNYTDPMELMDKYSVDSFRYLMLQSPTLRGEDFALKDNDTADIARKLSMVWNMYDFFTLYAEVDGWEPPEGEAQYVDPSAELKNPLDIWIISRVNQLSDEIEHFMNAYDIPNATKPILPFLDDASNWYVRRSRRRFWKSSLTDENAKDKQDAYRTLHYVLVRLAHIMAPFTPFLAEELYHKLTGGESVHLRDWPKSGAVDNMALSNMRFIREVITEGLSERAKAGIKVRQPLQSVTVKISASIQDSPDFREIISDEINVKEVKSTYSQAQTKDRPFLEGWEKRAGDEFVTLDLNITPELKREGQMREIVRQVQAGRKSAGLAVENHIALELVTHDAELQAAIHEHQDTIKSETLAETLTTDASGSAEGHHATVKIDGVELAMTIQKLA